MDNDVALQTINSGVQVIDEYAETMTKLDRLEQKEKRETILKLLADYKARLERPFFRDLGEGEHLRIVSNSYDFKQELGREREFVEIRLPLGLDYTSPRYPSDSPATWLSLASIEDYVL